MIKSRSIAKAVISLYTERGTHGTEQTSEQFLAFIQKYSLQGQLPAILAHIQVESEKEIEKNTVHIQTPFDMDSKTVASIKSLLHLSDTTRVVPHVDTDVLGGFVAYMDGTKTDASIGGALRRLEKSLLTH